VTLGLRYEYINAYAPAIQRSATTLANAASFPELDCLPCWHDIHPRMGIAYDLFGDGKTALKFSLGRYAGAALTGFATTFQPSAAAVTSTNRSWTDNNGDFYPNCDLRNAESNGECGPMANQAFGGVQIRTRPDPDWIRGWGKRPYNWQVSTSVDRELVPGVAINAGFFRTWFGNFAVTDNQLVTPADFDPYCIPAPTDSRLPSNVSGQQLCGFYDIKPALFGQVDNVVTSASKYGKWTESYNGVDFNVNARLPHGARIGGGWNIGNSVSLPPGMTFISSRQSRCFVVDSPQELNYPLSLHSASPGFANGCETANTYEQRFKLNGSYPLPWNLLVAAVFQDLPGAYYSSFYTATNAQIAPRPSA